MNDQVVNVEASKLAVKPGYKTSEFWLTAIANIVGLAVASGIIPETGPWSQVVGLAVMVLTTMGYQVQRGAAKK